MTDKLIQSKLSLTPTGAGQGRLSLKRKLSDLTAEGGMESSSKSKKPADENNTQEDDERAQVSDKLFASTASFNIKSSQSGAQVQLSESHSRAGNIYKQDDDDDDDDDMSIIENTDVQTESEQSDSVRAPESSDIDKNGNQSSSDLDSKDARYPSTATKKDSDALSSGDEDANDNRDKSKHGTSQHSSGPAWMGVAISELKRAPECYRRNNMRLESLRPSQQHKVFVEIPPGGFKDNHKLEPYARGSRDTWNDNYVYMPYNSENKMVAEDDNECCRWEVITKALKGHIPGSFELEEAILSYNPHYRRRWKFEALHRFFQQDDDGVQMNDEFFGDILPEIQKLALRLPKLCPKALPILKRYNVYDKRASKITLSQEQIACLLANAFFCTFPKRNVPKTKGSKLVDINFSNLFSDSGRNSDRERKFQKYKCLINYFKRVTKEVPCGTVTYTRQYVDTADFKNRVDNKFTKLHVSSTGTIEDDGWGMLQADFANKYVGGGVLGHGLVQEEIRFLICPEMILSRLFTEVLTDNEVLIMTGCERYSTYKGYSDTFKFSGNYEDKTERDEWGRRYTEVVAMDALVFHDYKSQFEKEKLYRELQKAYCAFRGSDFSEYLPAVCTGNWGCGAFGGDKQLKALIQMMAASAAGRDVYYLTFGDEKLCQEMGQIYGFLTEKRVSIRNIIELIKVYQGGLWKYNARKQSLFESIASNLGMKWKISEPDQDTWDKNYNNSSHSASDSDNEPHNGSI